MTPDTSIFTANKSLIFERKQHLEAIKVRLKSDFVGIDNIIDSLLEYIQIWYLMPEILTRPIIVCLWGMTGVGKTDLVRRLVKYLDFQDRFAEIELGNSDNTSWYSSVSTILSMNDIMDGKPAIVLFDEIQRFNTIEQDGSPVPNTKFTDFWELLSDGRLAKRTKDDLESYVNNYLLTQRQRKKDVQKQQTQVAPTAVDGQAPTPMPEDPMLEEIGLWEAEQIRKLLNLEEDIVEIAEMTKGQMLEKLLEAKRRKRVYEPIDHSRTLILISGNLDEAFRMAAQTSETDIDADIFHAFTKKITQVDIKNALTRRFRPEQVARFGNIHLIYNSLRKTDFEQLIEMEVGKIVEKTREKFGFQLTITPNLRRLIYRNGVFPVQGVRPVFSSIIDILETNISKILFEALMTDHRSAVVDYSFEQQQIVAEFEGEHRMLIPYVGRIDRIRQSNIGSVVTNISVHEAGHAVAYVVQFGLAPLQLKSKVASSYAAGFTFPHQIYETKENIIKKVIVFLAGGLAEEEVFGAQNATTGRAHDREQTTIMAMDFIRQNGFDQHFQANYMLENAYSMDRFKTDQRIEDMIAGLVEQTRSLLREHRQFLLALSRQLFEKGSMEAPDVAAVAQQFGLKAAICEEGYLHLPEYRID
jgi:Peptidase family M41/ATPase family associated with various cellular activities (AAA)